jgi:hypothetical protein
MVLVQKSGLYEFSLPSSSERNIYRARRVSTWGVDYSVTIKTDIGNIEIDSMKTKLLGL